MKKIFTTIADFFAFTKSERRGIVALLGILVCLMLGIQILPYCYSKPYNPEFSNEILEQLPSKNYRRNSRNNTSDTAPVRAGFTPAPASYSAKSQRGRPQGSPQQGSPQRIREKKIFTVQANICDTLDLQQIRGIGSAFSKRIIKYRDQLGGFVRKEQLREVWGIDSAKYAQIESAFIIDKKNIRKLNLNTVTINDLKNHPYLDYYQAKAIVQTREKQGLYENVADILKIALIDQETFDLIREYLEL